MFHHPTQQATSEQPQESIHPLLAKSKSFWVILGYLFWFGFYIGAMIMREVTK